MFVDSVGSMRGPRPTAKAWFRTTGWPNPVCAAVGAWLALSAFGCGGDRRDQRSDGPGVADSSSYATEPIALRARDIERYLTVMRELRRTGITLPSGADYGRTDGTPFTEWSWSPGAMRILTESDFDVPSLQRVTYSIMLAMAADDGSTAPAESLASPGTITTDAATRRRRSRIIESIRSQPAGNVELVRRYRADIEALHR
jgi:hypothetical protein